MLGARPARSVGSCYRAKSRSLARGCFASTSSTSSKRLAGKPPDEDQTAAQHPQSPLVEAFFAWAEARIREGQAVRGSAAGRFRLLSCVSRDALMRFLDDGRLRLDNNHSEGELRRSRRPQGLAVRRQRRPRHKRRPTCFRSSPRRKLAPPRPRGIPARPLPRPRAVAA